MPIFSTWAAPLAVLASGEQVSSDSPAWLLECEARRLLELPTRDDRLRELDYLQKRRGEPARKDLEQRILALWQLERAKL